MDKKEKRVVQIEIDDSVKKLTIEGIDKDQQVVMREEITDDELDNVAGGKDGLHSDLMSGNQDSNVNVDMGAVEDTILSNKNKFRRL